MALKYFIAISILVASGQLAAAQYIMQPSLGGTYSYGPESTTEVRPPTNEKAKRTAHRRVVRNQKDQGKRQPASRSPDK